MFCRNCGNELRDGAPFCGYCGTRVERKIACKNCGALVEDKFAFCLDCGTPLDKDTVAPAQAQVEQEAVENVAAPVAQEPAVEVETPVVQTVEQTDIPENKKRVKLSIAENIFAILGVLVALSFSIMMASSRPWGDIYAGSDYRDFVPVILLMVCIPSTVITIIASIRTLSGGKAIRLKKFALVGMLSYVMAFLFSDGSALSDFKSDFVVGILGCALSLLFAIIWIMLVVLSNRDTLFHRDNSAKSTISIVGIALSIALMFLTAYASVFINVPAFKYDGYTFYGMYSVPVYLEYATALSSSFDGATTAEVAQFSIFVISVLLVILPTALMDNLFRGKHKGLAFASPIFAFSLISLLVMWLSIEEFVVTLAKTGFGGSVSIFMFVIQFVFASALWATMIALTVQQRKLKLGKK